MLKIPVIQASNSSEFCYADYLERMPRTSSALRLQLSIGLTLTNTLLDTQMSVTLDPTNTFAPCLQQMKTHLW